MLRTDWKQTGYTTVGLDLVVSILFGFLGGRWLDGWLDTAPVLTLVGLAFGVAAGARFVWRAAARMKRHTETDGFRASLTDRSARFALEQRDDPRGRGQS